MVVFAAEFLLPPPLKRANSISLLDTSSNIQKQTNSTNLYCKKNYLFGISNPESDVVEADKPALLMLLTYKNSNDCDALNL